MSAQDGSTDPEGGAGAVPWATGERLDVVRLVRELSERSSRYADRAGAARGLHRSDLSTLLALARAREQGRAPLSPGVLARELMLSPSATTTLLDRLERSGHVERSHDAGDRRRVSLEMTASAGETARSMFGPVAAAMTEAMQDFSDDEIDVVRRFLGAMVEAVDAQDPGVASS